MTTELYWLTLTVLMTALFWVPYILDRFVTRGIWKTIAETKLDIADQSVWAQRAAKAHQNAVENLAIIVPAVLIAHALSVSTPVTQTAVMVYFFARLIHFITYLFAIPVLRTVAFLTGWGAQIAIILTILGWI
jgi:uncharacterized MAPEG superfamily protein